ncbi:hypothetical protein B0H66DRAFT_531744 [Apodospora peruviana]|uniref:Uncharacterized protein n=1 Tax=Apodospora peruviana TaxID=516989 RepID=A0AAE0IC56_9PEZI|nr:hypothetical protein B0H66DRAFT_531744 [Apodospora peruviana]
MKRYQRIASAVLSPLAHPIGVSGPESYKGDKRSRTRVVGDTFRRGPFPAEAQPETMTSLPCKGWQLVAWREGSPVALYQGYPRGAKPPADTDYMPRACVIVGQSRCWPDEVGKRTKIEQPQFLNCGSQ